MTMTTMTTFHEVRVRDFDEKLVSETQLALC